MTEAALDLTEELGDQTLPAIRIYPDPILREKCSPVDASSDPQEVQALLKEMAAVLRQAGGVGLAAPQIGYTSRVILVRNPQEVAPPMAMINPVVKASSGGSVEVEGCLSIPGYYDRVERAERITVSWLHPEGEKEAEIWGGVARVVQHEIDHLDGVLFTDRIRERGNRAAKRRVAKALARFELNRQP